MNLDFSLRLSFSSLFSTFLAGGQDEMKERGKKNSKMAIE
jgi:hypothetical protein